MDLCQLVDELRAENRLLRAHAYGHSKSERLGKPPTDTPSKADDHSPSVPQSESEAQQKAAPSDPSTQAPSAKPEENTAPQGAKPKRRRGHRCPLPKDLPRVERYVPVEPEEMHCGGCSAEKETIGQETAEHLVYKPASFYVEVTIRPKFACPDCEGADDINPVSAVAATVLESVATPGNSSDPGPSPGATESTMTDPPKPPTAAEPARPHRRRTVYIPPPPKQLIPKGIATASLLAHIVVTKFQDAVPLHRQQKQFERLGVHLSRTTMCRWLFAVAAA